MGSTSKYWIPIFNVFETETKMNIVLVHPKYIKAIKGRKIDKKYSKWICDFSNMINLNHLLSHLRVFAN